MTLSRFPFGGTGRGKSSAIWGVLDTAANIDPRWGYYRVVEFDGDVADDQVSVTALNSGTSAAFDEAEGEGGTRELTATTGADHRGAQVLVPALGGVKPGDDRIIVFEWTVDLNRCSTFFVGLVEDGITILDGSSDLSTDDKFIGFSRKNGGVVNFVSRLDSVSTVEVEDASYYHKEAAGESEPTRLGFAIRNNDLVVPVIDGVPKKFEAEDLDLTEIPDTVLTPALAAARGEDQDEGAVKLIAKRLEVFSSQVS